MSTSPGVLLLIGMVVSACGQAAVPATTVAQVSSPAAPTVITPTDNARPTHEAAPSEGSPDRALPSLRVGEVREGVLQLGLRGAITFGRDVDPGTLEIIDPSGAFSLDDPEIAWSASLSEEVHTSEIDIQISLIAAGVQTLVFRQTLQVASQQSNRFASRYDLPGLVNHRPGTYQMQFVRFDEGLAEGTFTLSPSQSSTPRSTLKATPVPEPPKPSGVTFDERVRVSDDEDFAEYTQSVTWQTPRTEDIEIRVYGVTRCLAEPEEPPPDTSGPCLLEHTALPASVRTLLASGPASDGLASWTWTVETGCYIGLPFDPEGPAYYAIVLAAYTASEHSIFAIANPGGWWRPGLNDTVC